MGLVSRHAFSHAPSAGRRTSASVPLALLMLLFGTAAHADPLLDRYVTEALASNSALQAQHFAVEAALQGLSAARGKRGPTVTLNARYTAAEGGRVIELPTGDLVNPVYQTLNQLTAGSANPTAFPQIDNTDIAFLRRREQDTRLSFAAPLYAPEIDAEVHLRAAQLEGSQATREAYARALVRDVKTAYLRAVAADAGVQVLEASRASLQANLRVAQALVAAGKATRDQGLRAEAELLDIEQRLNTARNEARAARRFLNLLRNQDENTPVDVRVDTTEPLGDGSAPASSRPELRQLDAQIDEAEGARKLVRAAYQPVLAVVADAGIQGVEYGSGRDPDVATVSLVLKWTLLDFGTRRAAVSRATAQANQLKALRQDVQRQLALARANAADRVQTTADSLSTAAARRAAAEESLRIAERKRDAGQLSQAEFIDAERSATAARMGLLLAGTEQRIAAAELEFTEARFPLPAVLSGVSP